MIPQPRANGAFRPRFAPSTRAYGTLTRYLSGYLLLSSQQVELTSRFMIRQSSTSARHAAPTSPVDQPTATSGESGDAHSIARSAVQARRAHLGVLALYTLLTLLLTWPMLAQAATHVPGVAQWAFDESTFLWNVWYFKHALVDHLSSPLH